MSQSIDHQRAHVDREHIRRNHCHRHHGVDLVYISHSEVPTGRTEFLVLDTNVDARAVLAAIHDELEHLGIADRVDTSSMEFVRGYVRLDRATVPSRDRVHFDRDEQEDLFLAVRVRMANRDEQEEQ